MRFSLVVSLLTAVAALVSAKQNPIMYPSSGVAVEAGRSLTIKWQPTTSGTISLRLRSGNAVALDPGTVIVSAIPNSGSFTFRIPKSTPYSAYYSIEIINDLAPNDPNQQNYSAYFVINSNAPSPSLSSSSAISTITTAMPGAHTHESSKTTKQRVKLAAAPTSADIAGTTQVIAPGMAAGLDVSRGMAAIMAVGAGVAIVL